MSEQSSFSRADVRESVRQRYSQVAVSVLEGKEGGCCGAGGCDPITANLYAEGDANQIPVSALQASLGCGNPSALAELRAGEVVLDLGSGGGIDVLLSAKRVGSTGFVYGLDMTDAMLELAERNRQEAKAENVRFLKGHIEAIPLPEASVDVLISNCVINLSADKDAVLREAFRVLKPGGRFAVSDVVTEGALPPALKQSMEAYVGCVAGALEREDYAARLAKVGFAEVSITPTRRYLFAETAEAGCYADAIAALTPEERSHWDGKIMGAFIRAQKPLA